jgi:dephospho-CoA kinase
MTLIALTGGIASGKSTIARRLAEHGAVIVDADAIVRDVQQPGSPVLTGIVRGFRFRRDRARRVARPRRARAGLRQARGPCAPQRDRAPGRASGIGAEIRRGAGRRPEAVVVYDVPLLVEARATTRGTSSSSDAPAELRARRLVELRGRTLTRHPLGSPRRRTMRPAARSPT